VASDATFIQMVRKPHQTWFLFTGARSAGPSTSFSGSDRQPTMARSHYRGRVPHADPLPGVRVR